MLMGKQLFYAGGYAESGPCLHLCEYGNGEVSVRESYDIKNSAYFCISKSKKFLYAVSETDEFMGKPGGGAAAYSIGEGGRLTFVNSACTLSESSCHLSVDEEAGRLYVASYVGGSVSIFKLNKDGGIGEYLRKIDNNKRGNASRAFAERQESAHAHFVSPLSMNGVKTVWVCDLGLDRVFVLDAEGEIISEVAAEAGAGPRHLAFHQSKNLAYQVNELSCDIYTYKYGAAGDVRLVGKSPCIPNPEPKDTCAAIRVSPGGGHLFASVRGADYIAVMKLDGEGMPGEYIKVKTDRCPRDFNFNVAGNKVFVANQDSDLITVYDWDEKNSGMVPEKASLSIKSPACVVCV